jgi:hypothetical protein
MRTDVQTKGTYGFSVAVVDGEPATPLIRLAIKGRAEDGCTD